MNKDIYDTLDLMKTIIELKGTKSIELPIDDFKKIYILFNNVVEKNIKATRHLEILLELALEQDSENVNLIDRLKGISDILKGVDKE